MELKDIDPKNDQQVFDFVVGRMLAQGRRSMVTLCYGEECAYRSLDGDKCAAGHLIPDEDYNEHWEGAGVCTNLLPGELNAVNEYFKDRGFNVNLISSLQSAHDGAEDNFCAEFAAAALEIAARFGLEASDL